MYSVSARQHIRQFYEKLKQGPAPATYHDIDFLWQGYRNQLDDQSMRVQLEALSYIIRPEPVLLPDDFTYQDILKAIFLLALPDIFLAKFLDIHLRGDLQSSLKIEEKDAKKYVMVEGDKQNETFEKMVIDNELLQAKSSGLYALKDYLKNQTTLDRYTEYQFSYLFLEAVAGDLQVFFQDLRIANLVANHFVGYTTAIDYFHDFYAWVLGWYIKGFESKHDLDNHKLLWLAQESRHLNILHLIGKNIRDITKMTDLPGMTVQYIQVMKKNILLRFLPCIQENHINLSRNIYRDDEVIREQLKSADSDTRDQVKLKLGLDSSVLNLKPYICEHFVFSNQAFKRIPKESNLLKQHILCFGIAYLSYIDQRKCPEALYVQAIEYLFDSFFKDVRCQQQRPVSMMVSLSDKSDKSFEGAILQCIQGMCFMPMHAETFAKEKAWFMQLTVDQLSFIAAFLQKQSLSEARFVLSEEETLFLIYFQDEAQSLSDDVMFKAINNILYCHYFSLTQRLVLVGIIASRGLDENFISAMSEKKITFCQKLSCFQSLNHNDDLSSIKQVMINAQEDIVLKVIDQLARQTSLPQLIEHYELAKINRQPTRWLCQRLLTLCEPYRDALAEVFMSLASPVSEGSTFFKSKKKDLNHVVEMVTRGELMADVLFELKKMASSSKHASPFYQALDDFFASQGTIEDLLELAKANLPAVSTLSHEPG